MRWVILREYGHQLTGRSEDFADEYALHHFAYHRISGITMLGRIFSVSIGWMSIVACAFGSELSAESSAKSQEGSPLALAQIVAEAAVVARVRITARTPISLLGRPQTEACGYLLKAVPVESFKGKPGSFDFFSAADITNAGLDKEYLVFVYKRQPDQVLRELTSLQISSLLTIRQLNDLYCKATNEYYVPVEPNLIIPFSDQSQEALAGAWLDITNSRGAIMWCMGDSKTPSQHLIERRDQDVSGSKKVFLQWQGIKWLISFAQSSTSLLDRLGGKYELGPC